MLTLTALQLGGAVAQLGARLDGIEEVVGSNPIGSTNSSAIPYYLYILQSETTNRYYIGQTVDVAARIAYKFRVRRDRAPLTRSGRARKQNSSEFFNLRLCLSAVVPARSRTRHP